MNDFVVDLERRLREAAAEVSVSSGFGRRTLVRAKRRRRINGALAGAAIVLAALAVGAGAALLPNGGDDRRPIPPAASIPAGKAERLGSKPCSYGRPVLARDDSLDARARCAWRAVGDVDGDGRPDEIYSYGIAHGPTKASPKWRRSRWFLQVDLAAGVRLSTTFSTEMKLGMPVTPQLAGAADADTDGASEIFLATDVGNGATLSIYAVDHGRLDEVHEPPRPFAVNVVNSLNYRASLTCADVNGDGVDELVVDTAAVAEGGAFTTSRATYEWVGESTVEQSALVTATIGPEDAALDAYGALDCAGLEWRP